MLLRETIQTCAECEERTPHSRRLFALPLLLALASGLAAGGFLARGPLAAALVLLGVAALLVSWDRARYWHVHCERCRGKLLAHRRALRPTLDGRTEIHFLG